MKVIHSSIFGNIPLIVALSLLLIIYLIYLNWKDRLRNCEKKVYFLKDWIWGLLLIFCSIALSYGLIQFEWTPQLLPHWLARPYSWIAVIVFAVAGVYRMIDGFKKHRGSKEKDS